MLDDDDLTDAYGQPGWIPDEVDNRKRIRSSLGSLTSAEFEQQRPREQGVIALR